MITTYLYKDAFAVIGKAGHGPADKGPEWIQPLWEAAGASYPEIADVCKKSGSGGLFWWGAMNDSEEQNKVWGDTGKYMAGCEADVSAAAPEGWTKWIIPAQTYLVVSASPDKYGEVFRKVMSDKTSQSPARFTNTTLCRTILRLWNYGSLSLPETNW